jgi:thioesterase domain-containing protein/acyl carrier protein
MPSQVAAVCERLTATEKKVAAIWGRTLELDRVNVHEDFFHSGGDSLMAVQLLAEIKREFGKDLPLSDLLESPTVEKLAALVDEGGSRPAPSPLVPLQPAGAAPPFFCVHGVGGCVLAFSELARAFASHQPFYGIQAAADSNGGPHRSIAVMAAHYLQAVRAVQPAGPYYLGGFSFGGSVALEMAQQLHAQGEAVPFLAILDHTPPPVRYRRFTWSLRLPVDLVLNAARWLVEDIWNAGRGSRLAALRGRLAVAMAQLRGALRARGPATGRTDAEEILGHQGLPDSFREGMALRYQALREYQPKPYPGRVTLFRARVRPLLRLHGRDLGWARLAGGGLDVIDIPGNHQTLLTAPHVTRASQALLARLCRAQAQAVGAAHPPSASEAEGQHSDLPRTDWRRGEQTSTHSAVQDLDLWPRRRGSAPAVPRRVGGPVQTAPARRMSA